MDDELILEHHGVKGQKWGIRRTPAQLGHKTSSGRKRKMSSTAKKVKRRSVGRKAVKKASTKKKTSKKSIKDMSNDELRSAIDRMKLEQDYVKAYRELNPVQVSKGKKFVNAVVNDVVGPAAKEAGKEIVKKAILKAAGVQETKKKQQNNS